MLQTSAATLSVRSKPHTVLPHAAWMMFSLALIMLIMIYGRGMQACVYTGVHCTLKVHLNSCMLCACVVCTCDVCACRKVRKASCVGFGLFVQLQYVSGVFAHHSFLCILCPPHNSCQ